MRAVPMLIVVALLAPVPARAAELTGRAAELYARALAEGTFTATFRSVGTEVNPTSDNRSFWVLWQRTERPARWMVLLHGAGNPAHGFATDEFASWLPHVIDRDIGVISLQWWVGTGSTAADFLTPTEVYQEVGRVLQLLGVTPGTVLFEGFSRGSANTYAVKAIDAGLGASYFALTIASSGCYEADYPPNVALNQGEYGERPLAGTRWITAAGARDPEPDCGGISGMRATAEWLVAQGADVLTTIEDPTYGHGALVLNPTNARLALDYFFALPVPSIRD